MTSCQENKYFLAGRPDPKAKYQWMHTHPPIFNMIQYILELAGTSEIMQAKILSFYCKETEAWELTTIF